MDDGELEKLETLFHGTEATPEQIDYIDTLALSLLEAETACIQLNAEFTNDKTGANVTITSEMPDGGDIDQSSVYLYVGYDKKDDWDYRITFNAHNEIVESYYPLDKGEAALESAQLAISEVLAANHEGIEEHVIAVLNNLRDQVAYVQNPHSNSQQKIPAQDGNGGRIHMAGEARRIAINHGFGNMIKFKKIGQVFPAPDLGIETVEVELREVNIPGEVEPRRLIEVALRDTFGSEHLYLRSPETATYVLARGEPLFEDEDASSDEDEDNPKFEEELFDFYQEMHQDFVTPEAATLFRNVLEEVAMNELEPEVADNAAPFTYPELTFGFREDKFSESKEGLDVTLAVTEILQALDAATRLRLPELCVDGFPIQPAYVYSTNRKKRVTKLMQTRTRIPEEGKVSRADAIDLHIAAQDIMDQLSYENHPVAQAMAQLYNNYGDMLGDVFLQRVNTELIVQTHESRIRRYYGERIGAQRLAGEVIAHTLRSQYMTRTYRQPSQ